MCGGVITGPGCDRDEEEGAMNEIFFRDDYLEAKIEDYKYGVITAEEFCKAMEDLGKYPLLLVDRNLDRITNCMIPEICKSYMEADASDKDRDLKFWIGLKDCEYLMHFGWTFTEEREEYYRTGRDRRDPIEYTDRYLAIEPEMEKLVRAETGEGGWLGFCHTYWAEKKKVLKEHFGIDWKSTDDRFPGLRID